jgi:tetratricopeptide (TPR) repeat protein
MEQFAQRIAVEYALEPLSEEDTVAYIGHRVRVARGRRPLFSSLACRKIFALAGGVPRLINQLCDHALVYGYAAQAETVTARVVLDAAHARDQHGLFPLRVVPEAIEPSQRERDEEIAEASEVWPVTSDPKAPPMKPSAERRAVDAGASYCEAIALKQAGEFSRAIALLDQLTGDRLWTVKALAQKGICLKSIGRYEDALASFRTALDQPSESKQDRRSLRYLFARTLESMGKFDEAAECYRMISRDSIYYRDVAGRLDQLQAHGKIDNGAAVTFRTWLHSVVRSCSHLLRSAG